MSCPEAYEKLRRAIYSGALGAGERIVERDLARQFRISRIPLRESLVRLQAEGLVRSVPFSSHFVEEFEPADVMEIFSLRLLFEPLAARLLAAHPSKAAINTLQKLCQRMTQASNRRNLAALDRADYEFHRTIVEACGHRRLLRAYDSAHIRILSSQSGQALFKGQPPEATARQHHKIIDKIAQGDLKGAERVAQAHVERSIRAVERELGITRDDIPVKSAGIARISRRNHK